MQKLIITNYLSIDYTSKKRWIESPPATLRVKNTTLRVRLTEDKEMGLKLGKLKQNTVNYNNDNNMYTQ